VLGTHGPTARDRLIVLAADGEVNLSGVGDDLRCTYDASAIARV